MKKWIAMLCLCLCVLAGGLPVWAADGTVSYSGNAGSIIFAPGSTQSPTDLFVNFKDVMPGDRLTQTITVRNDASRQVKVKIYLRAWGALPGSEQFLSQLRLQVQPAAGDPMAYMFDAAAHETAQLTEWVCLGTLYSGGKVDLNVTLQVPVELDDRFQQQTGILQWEFKVEEYPIETGDPEAPKTGDTFGRGLWLGLMGSSAAAMVVLLLVRKRHRKDAE